MNHTNPIVNLKVDGKPVAVPMLSPNWRGELAPTTILQACIAAGVTVPHFCYHPKLPIAGNCRMCLVEVGFPMKGPDGKPLLNPDGSVKIQKSPRPVTACTTPITPNMEIYTNTPAVQKMRQGVLEFLLANHPLDCPICDQAGECRLQEYTTIFGHQSSRFNEIKTHKPKAVQLGPYVMYDPERCILCTRCVRFTREIVGDDVLGILNRGARCVIGVYPGKKFDNNYTLNTVDLCPVGALTSIDFRFKMRVWFLKETPSICPGCGTGCNITIWSRQNVIYRITPRENPDVNGPWMCDLGRFTYKLVLSPIRLTRPYVKGRPTTAQAAVQELAKVLSKATPDSTAIIVSGGLSTEELWTISKLKSLLCAISDCIPATGPGDKLLLSQDRNPNSLGAKLTNLAPESIGENIPNILSRIDSGDVRTLLIFGADLRLPELSDQLISKLENLVVWDVVRTPLAEKAHIALPGATFAEKDGTFVSQRGRVQKFYQAVTPPGDAKPIFWWLSHVIQELSGEKTGTTTQEVFRQMAAELAPLNGMTWESLPLTGEPIQVNSP